MLAKNDAANGISQTVVETISAIMAERGLDTDGINESAKLVDTLGLKSMDIAQIVLILEDELETDPFQDIPITSIRTVGDLIGAYVVTLDPTLAPNTEMASVAEQPALGVSRRVGRRR